MARITRRNFVQASGALASAPALATVTAQRSAAGAPDIGNLRAEKDIVFGKGGDMDMTLDVYHPPEGVTPKRMAIIHLFGGGFFAGNKNAGYIINDAKALGARGYTSISANYRLAEPRLVAGADSRREGGDPLDARERRASSASTPNRIAVAGYSAGGMLVADGGRHERQAGVRGQRRHAGRQLEGQRLHRRLSARERADRARPVRRRVRATPEAIAAARRRRTSAPNFAPTIFIHGTADTTVPVSSSIDFFTKLHAANVPTALTLIQGADHAFDNGALDAVEVMAQSIDLFLDRLFVNPRPYPAFGGGGGGSTGRGGGGGPAVAAVAVARTAASVLRAATSGHRLAAQSSGVNYAGSAECWDVSLPPSPALLRRRCKRKRTRPSPTG